VSPQFSCFRYVCWEIQRESLARFSDGQTFLSFELVVSEEGAAGGIEGHVCTCLL
jgi:hypothetical protein